MLFRSLMMSIPNMALAESHDIGMQIAVKVWEIAEVDHVEVEVARWGLLAVVAFGEEAVHGGGEWGFDEIFVAWAAADGRRGLGWSALWQHFSSHAQGADAAVGALCRSCDAPCNGTVAWCWSRRRLERRWAINTLGLWCARALGPGELFFKEAD